MNDKCKIRVAVCANNLAVNGISTVIMNYTKNINLNRFEITILAGIPVEETCRSVCCRPGASIVALPERKTSSLSYYLALYRNLNGKHYDIFHIHGNSATVTLELLIAAVCRIPVRIAHSHNTRCTRSFVHKILSPLFPHTLTHAFACGTDAGRWLFKDREFQVIPNGFSTEQFRFQNDLRRKIRRKYSLDGFFVIGHIGRFNSQKNQPFLLEIFRHAADVSNNICLLLVGNGPDYKKTTELIKNHPHKDRIIVCKETARPEEMYAAMDLFVLPSLYEGFPVVLLEAQINGLPCLVSDTVTREAWIGNQIRYLSLLESADNWTEEILNTKPLSVEDREKFYSRHLPRIGEFHIKNNVKLLEAAYLSAIQDRAEKHISSYQEDLS